MSHTANPFGGAQGRRVVGIGRLAVIFAWAAFLAFAWITTEYPHPGKPGRLEIINPSYRWLSLASAVALVLVGAALLTARQHEHSHHPEDSRKAGKAGNHNHEETGLESSCCLDEASPGELVFHALFLAPIVLSLCTTGGGLSGSSLARRGIHEVRLAASAQIRPAPAQLPNARPGEVQSPVSMTDIYNYLLVGAPAELPGRPVDLVGQYFADERCGDNQFVVTRIVVTCCLADAEVIGLRAQTKKPFTPEAGQRPWISVSGKLKVLNDRFGNPALFVDAAAVSEIPPPVDILLYPRQRRAPW